MNNIKTTVSGIVGGLAWIVARFGLDVPAEVTDGIIVLTTIVVGYFARDGQTSQNKAIEVNPSILPNVDRSAEVRQRVSDKTKLKRID